MIQGQLGNKAESNTVFKLSNSVSLVPVMNLPQQQAKLCCIFSVSAFGHALTQAIRVALHSETFFITPYFFIPSHTDLSATLEPIQKLTGSIP